MRLAGSANGALGRVEFQIGDFDDGGLCFIFSPHHRPDPGQQFGEQERFDEIIISPEFQARDSVLRSVLGGEKENH